MLAGFFLDGFPLDQEHLANVREVEVGIERRTAPNAARLDAAMGGRCDLDEISGIALLEQQPDIAWGRIQVASRTGSRPDCRLSPLWRPRRRRASP